MNWVQDIFYFIFIYIDQYKMLFHFGLAFFFNVFL